MKPHEVAQVRVLAPHLRVPVLRHVAIATLLGTECADDVSTVDGGADVAEEGAVGDLDESDGVALRVHVDATHDVQQDRAGQNREDELPVDDHCEQHEAANTKTVLKTCHAVIIVVIHVMWLYTD